MPLTRHFLGWDGPALQRAAVYLHKHHGQGQGGWDLSHLIAVVPAQRAGRRLIELLVTQAQTQDHPLVPPRIVTAGGLPELLYQPHTPTAGELESHLAWVQALRQIEADVIADLLPKPPKPDDLPGWWAQAQQLRTLYEDLAGHRMRFADVPRLCAERGVDLRGEQRWEVLDLIEQGYHQTLTDLGLADRHLQRLQAINENRCALITCNGDASDKDQVNNQANTHLVLIATPDLNDAAAAMLQQVGDAVTSLVMAPNEHQDGFDELGLLRATYWQEQSVELCQEQVRFVDRIGDQAHEVLRFIGEAEQRTGGEEGRGDDGGDSNSNGGSDSGGGDREGLSADQITIGLGDERFAGVVQRRLGLAGVPSRHAAGTPAPQTRPAVLLRSLGRFMENRRLDALAELLRHPDTETYLQRSADAGQDARPTIEQWLTLLDTYATEHLQGRLTGDWLGQAQRRKQLKALWDKVVALLPAHPAQRQPLPKWSQPIAEALQQVYADTSINEHNTQDQRLAQSLELIAELLRDQSELSEQAPHCPTVTASQAIALTLSRLAEKSLADEGGEPAVELLGYLELALDDAPVLAVTGMNEGHVPSSRNADAFLPDSVRSALSMHDNNHRYARDLMLLNAITHSRPNATLIAARRSDDGDPLTLSRLLLACEDDTLVDRVRAFFDDHPDAPPAPLPLESGATSRFLIPRPQMTPEPINKLRVTAFRDYLACPYRFYLRHVLRLRAMDDRAVEMDPMSFGTLAHNVLQTLGVSDLKHCDNPDAIAEFLGAKLDEIAEQRFGKGQRPAVRVQIEQLRQRLTRFADEQAKLVREGWRIQYVEQKLEAVIDVDGQPFTVTGTVDRIDRHDTLGYRVYDYKTGDSAKPPEKTHRTTRDGEKVWTDLQLPLYRDLCATLGVTGEVELGYINLPKTLKDVGPAPASWDGDDLHEAEQTRDGVIRALRQQVFWPPSDPPKYPDGLERVCADSAMRRQAVIDASAGAEVGR